MKVFVTGGTGEIGRPAVAALVASRHDVQVSSRSEANDRRILSMGAIPVRTDLFDRASVHAAVEDAEAIVHLATRIPPPSEMGELSAWVENDRLRREATEHLVRAARHHGTSVVVLQSYFAVGAPADRFDGDRRPWSGIGVMDSMRDAELAMDALTGSDTRAVVLRFGSLYSESSDQLWAQVDALRSGTAVVPGDGKNHWPFIASSDAGHAAARALSIPSGTYDVTDDEPVELRAFWRMAAAAVGVPEPPHGGSVSGPMAQILLGSWRPDNGAFRRAARWDPEQPSVLVGWPLAATRLLASAPRATAEGG